MTFLRKRVVPKTPPSLVKLAAIASGVMTGCWSSTPTNDQVPELIYPQPTGDVTGVETTAEPVSCVAGATTRTGPNSLRNSGKTSASIVPASTTGGSKEKSAISDVLTGVWSVSKRPCNMRLNMGLLALLAISACGATPFLIEMQ